MVATRKRAAARPPTSRAARAPAPTGDATQLIDQRLRDLGGWRGPTLARLRALIRAAVPSVVEEVKWRGTPVWSHDGIICTGEAYQAVVKLTFARGAAVPDPAHLFNASLEGSTRRAIDLREGEQLDARAFSELIQAAAATNTAARAKRARTATRPGGPASPARVGAARGRRASRR